MSNSPKTILITGGCGFIGSNLVRAIIRNTAYRVHNIDALTYAGNPMSLRDIESSDQYSFSRINIVDKDAVRKVMDTVRPSAVMHLAAESHVDRSIDSPGEFIQTNIVGTYSLLASSHDYYKGLSDAERKTFRFLHVSTDEVFGSLGPSGYFSESTPYSPHSPYSATKAGSDHLVRAWGDTFGLPVLITNCSNNYGPYQFPEKLIPVIILKCLKEESIPVYGNGENIRDWLHVHDHCSALLRVLEEGLVGQTYVIGGNNELKNIDLVRLVCSILDDLHPRSNGTPYSSLIRFVADRPGHDMRYAIDATKIREQLNWQPSVNAQSGFRQTITWYLENRDWWQAILDGSYRLERLGVLSE